MTNQPQIVEVGFRVYEPAGKRAGKTTERPISREFTVRESAEQFCAIARRSGHPDAFVRAVLGVES